MILSLSSLLQCSLKTYFNYDIVSRLEATTVTRYVSTINVVSLVGLALYSKNYILLTATVIMAIASTVNGMHTPILSLPPVDWFHYGMTLSNYFMVAALCSHDVMGIRVIRETFDFFSV